MDTVTHLKAELRRYSNMELSNIATLIDMEIKRRDLGESIGAVKLR
jgi:hypothetical protein